MKSVCFVVDSISGLGGIQRVVATICNELNDEYDISIITRKKVNCRKATNYNINSNIKIVCSRNWAENFLYFPIRTINYLNRRYKFLNKDGKIYEFLTYRSRLIESKKIVRYLNKNRIDYVIAAGLGEIVFLTYLKEKVNSYFIACWHSSFDNYIQDYSKRIIQRSLTIPDKTLVLSKNDSKILKREFNCDVEYLYNPIKIDKRFRSNLSNNVFLTVGRLDPVKQFDLMIKAFEIFHITNKKWKLRIIGEGAEREKLQNMINEKKLSNYVILAGKTNNVFEEYKQASIFLLTSNSEGMPMCILEAMMCKLPIIAFDIPVLHEMLNEKNKITKQNDITNFAKEMTRLANSYEMRQEIGTINMKEIERFNIDTIISRWKEIIN